MRSHESEDAIHDAKLEAKESGLFVPYEVLKSEARRREIMQG